jgi:hypothetical protein
MAHEQNKNVCRLCCCCFSLKLTETGMSSLLEKAKGCYIEVDNMLPPVVADYFKRMGKSN